MSSTFRSPLNYCELQLRDAIHNHVCILKWTCIVCCASVCVCVYVCVCVCVCVCERERENYVIKSKCTMC